MNFAHFIGDKLCEANKKQYSNNNIIPTWICFGSAEFVKMGKKKYKVQQKTKVEYIIDNTDTKKIVVDIEQGDEGYSGSNALVLPSAKREVICLHFKNPLSRNLLNPDYILIP